MLKPVKRTQTVSVVSVFDAAVDLDRSPKDEDGVLLYASKRIEDPGCWRAHIVLKEGERPTEFLIGVVPSSVLNRIDDECSPLDENVKYREMCWRCFLSGVRDIESFGAAKVKREMVDGMDYVSAEWLRRTFVGELRRVAIEIGAVVWRWNQLQSSDAKN